MDEMDTPVILSFAMTAEEWAHVAAILKFATIQANERAKTNPKPEKVSTAMDTADRFHNMIHDEMKRRAKR